MCEDLAFQLDEFGSGRDPEFRREHPARFAYGGQGIGLLAASIAGQNELRPERFMQRMQPDELFERRECLAMASSINQRLRAQLMGQNVHARPLPCSGVGPLLSRELVERRTPPKSQRFVE